MCRGIRGLCSVLAVLSRGLDCMDAGVGFGAKAKVGCTCGSLNAFTLGNLLHGRYSFALRRDLCNVNVSIKTLYRDEITSPIFFDYAVLLCKAYFWVTARRM
jgi:hypothetical protein